MTTISANNNGSQTHDVVNVATDLGDFNAFQSDQALVDAVNREGGEWATDELSAFGRKRGNRGFVELGFLANKFKPELHTHDRFGRRIDEVTYHDAYHQLMISASEDAIHSSPWTNPKPGAVVARTAKSMMQAAVEAGHGCPMTMTFACIPSIRMNETIAAEWEPKILANSYDPRNVPISDKTSAKIGMGMTEKQGGSDVRANSTSAQPIDDGDGAYTLVGHKWFMSAPMCDAFLVLAQAPDGLSCFLMPRWLPDGSKNPWEIIRLKNKMGNVSNASSEVEFRGAVGWLIGAEGRGVPTIIEMVNLTRFDCMLGTTGQMRAAITQIMHHCQNRTVFGKRLTEQPLMQNVLADLALEYEAAIALSMRMARALDNKENIEAEALLARIGMAIGKYWICKRAPQHAYEAMECIGGSGVMEESIMPRLYRDAVINPIWEGSGNVQCLDVLRAMSKSPDVVEAYFQELQPALGNNNHFDQFVGHLQKEFGSLDDLELRARAVVEKAALALQATLLIQYADNDIADAFCESRLNQTGTFNYGTLPASAPLKKLIERANPHTC